MQWAQQAIYFASSLGEVPRILPTIIILFASTQLFVSNRYRGVKDMFYLSVKGLVYGGISIVSFRLVSFGFVSFRFVSFHFVSCRFVSLLFVSFSLVWFGSAIELYVGSTNLIGAVTGVIVLIVETKM